ncbi:DUF362 domain-containing protein [Candidatus Fermentibacteria bacterium]|nr:DUF362 domain-containing protein [Candidatus Fermentibacteria bacterium]
MPSLGHVSRRDFMRQMALAATSTVLPWSPSHATSRSGNILPGRIGIIEDLNASTGSTVNLNVVTQMVDTGLIELTGNSDPVTAWESLFPELDATKRITIKVNILNDLVPTRWEMVKGITDRLVQMLGGTFPPGNITIFDKVPSGFPSTMAGCGFTAGHFPGIVISGESNPDTEVWVGDTTLLLSSHIATCDYFINCPVLKDHHQAGKRWTLGFKNHIGSVSPMTCHSYEPRLLSLSASPHLQNKTKLIITSAIHAIFTNGPEGPAQGWSLFPEESTPNLIMLSTDPVSSEHWGIHLINQQRAIHNITIYQDTYCQHAAEPPYNLGVYDFAAHDVFTSLPSPQNLSASHTGLGTMVSWSPVAGASKYIVFRSGDPYFAPDPWGGTNVIGETTGTSYLDADSATESPGYYIVRAFRACWYSADSARVAVFSFPLDQ